MKKRDASSGSQLKEQSQETENKSKLTGFAGFMKTIGDAVHKAKRSALRFLRSTGVTEITPGNIFLSPNNGKRNILKKIASYGKRHRNILVPAAVVSVLLAVGIYIGAFYSIGLNVYSDSGIVASVSSREKLDSFVYDFERRFTMELGDTFKVDRDFYYEFSLIPKNKIDKFDNLETYLINSGGDIALMYALKINGNVIGCTFDQGKLQKMLDDIKARYSTGDDGEVVEFVQIIEVEECYAKRLSYKSIDTIEQIITDPKRTTVTYAVRHDDTLASVAGRLGMTIEEFEMQNPGVTGALIRAGNMLELVKTEPLLSVRTSKVVTVSQPVEYSTITRWDVDMYNNESLELVAGKDGEQLVTKQVVSVNGVPSEITVLQTELKVEPKNRVLKQGLQIPPTKATGEFGVPVDGLISSRFGRRGGERHTGLDIATCSGSPIYAADGGTVTYAGWKGTYGYLVIIDHENGYETWYAHCSKIHVNEGDELKKGDYIADVGSTGRSTGCHLHLEIRKDGLPINPEEYLDLSDLGVLGD